MKQYAITWAFLILVLAMAYQAKYYVGANPVIRPPLNRIEPFKNMAATAILPDGKTEFIDNLAPADASLKAMREPYALLKDRLSLSGPEPTNSISSAACYDADFQKRLEMTGNYRQITNNYRRGAPDSCSAPLHELIMKTYKAEPLPFSGCLKV